MPHDSETPTNETGTVHVPERGAHTDASTRKRMRILCFLFLALFLVVPLTAGLVIYLYGPEVEREAYANLKSIAHLKAEPVFDADGQQIGKRRVMTEIYFDPYKRLELAYAT